MTKEKQLEYVRTHYEKWYRTSHKGAKGNKGTFKLLNNYDYRKWKSVFTYMYQCWISGIIKKDCEGFYEGMKLHHFKMLWCDKRDLLNDMYLKLSRYDGYII